MKLSQWLAALKIVCKAQRRTSGSRCYQEYRKRVYRNRQDFQKMRSKSTLMALNQPMHTKAKFRIKQDTIKGSNRVVAWIGPTLQFQWTTLKARIQIQSLSRECSIRWCKEIRLQLVQSAKAWQLLLARNQEPLSLEADKDSSILLWQTLTGTISSATRNLQRSRNQFNSVWLQPLKHAFKCKRASSWACLSASLRATKQSRVRWANRFLHCNQEWLILRESWKLHNSI